MQRLKKAVIFSSGPEQIKKQRATGAEIATYEYQIAHESDEKL
jgi:hypothetical protein